MLGGASRPGRAMAGTYTARGPGCPRKNSRQTGAMRMWTVEEANEALPWVTEVVEQIREVRKALSTGAPALAGRTNGKAASDPRAPIRRAIEELMGQGIVLRDPDRGLIDFPAVTPSGRRYWLCWV